MNLNFTRHMKSGVTSLIWASVTTKSVYFLWEYP